MSQPIAKAIRKWQKDRGIGSLEMGGEQNQPGTRESRAAQK
jgi:hypothetical protein